MSVLWCTSFNDEIYKASGKKLIDSFYSSKTEGKLFVGNEGTFGKFTNNYDKIIEYDLWKSKWLADWLKNNQDISPPKPCLCKDPWARKEKDHVKNCPHSWFNRNTWRWIKKIATLHAAINTVSNQYNYLCWVDADCEFTNKMTQKYLEDILFESDRYDMCYLKSDKRKVLEAGFHCYDLNSAAVLLYFNRLFEGYSSGEFRKLSRWDDSYVIQKAMPLIKTLKPRDIAWNTVDKFGGVFGASLIQHHIVHNKGRHGRQLGIMK